MDAVPVLEPAEQDLFVSGRYVDRYERRDWVWNIAHRIELFDGQQKFIS